MLQTTSVQPNKLDVCDSQPLACVCVSIRDSQLVLYECHKSQYNLSILSQLVVDTACHLTDNFWPITPWSMTGNMTAPGQTGRGHTQLLSSHSFVTDTTRKP